MNSWWKGLKELELDLEELPLLDHISKTSNGKGKKAANELKDTVSKIL